jgi:hypothetical protein
MLIIRNNKRKTIIQQPYFIVKGITFVTPPVIITEISRNINNNEYEKNDTKQ